MLVLMGFISLLQAPTLASSPVRVTNLNSLGAISNETTRFDCLRTQDRSVELQAFLETSPQWEPCHHDVPNFAYTTDIVWLRLPLELQVTAAQPWILELEWPHLDQVDVFVPNPDGQYRQVQLGQRVALKDREINHRHSLVALRDSLTAQQPVYLRIESENLLLIPLRIQPRDAFLQDDLTRQSFLCFFYGLMFAMLVYNALSWFKTREEIFKDYALFLLSFALLTSAIDKMSTSYIWPHLPGFFEREVPLFAAALTYTLIRLSRSYLEIPDRAPRQDRLLSIHIGIAMIGVLVLLILPHRFGAVMILGNGLVATFPFTVFAIQRAIQGEQAGRHFIVAWGALILGIIVVILRNAGIFDMSFITQYGIHVGGTIGVLTLAVGISNRINALKEERAEALDQALRVQQDAADNLQREVERQTEKIRLQAQREAENMKELMSHSERLALLGQLVSSVAHEMNNPIGSLRLNASLQQSTLESLRSFLEDLTAELSPKDLETVAPLFTNLDTLEESIITAALAHQRLLDVSSALRNQSRRDNEKSLFSLSELVKETLLIAKVRMQNIELTHDNLDTTVWARRSHIGQILTNLITNAADALEEHGIQNKKIHLDVIKSEELNTITVTVQDNGPGVPMKIRESIFENFFTTKEAGKGTGLGLHIAREIAREHNGELWVDGESGQGACFHLRLPHLPEDYS